MAAAAKAALRSLLQQPFEPRQSLVAPDRAEPLEVPVVSAAPLACGAAALAISHCDPGDGLDLTRGLEIWVRVEWTSDPSTPIQFTAGEGVGTHAGNGALCMSPYADQVLHRNLMPLLPRGRGLGLEVIFPRGRSLASRTSNSAFGVVDGLALIGMQADVQQSAAPDQLRGVLDQLAQLTFTSESAAQLTLVIGENGLDLARQLGLDPLLKVGNWLGPVLVAAADAGVSELLLLGYHGKLVKLAGGIFHTHHHLADARQEVLTALGLDAGLSLEQLRLVRDAPSVEQALAALEADDPCAAQRLWSHLAETVEHRAEAYVARYGTWPMRIGAVLFDRSRALRWRGPLAVERFFTLKD